MDIISAISQKGGTGKTSTVINLGCALSKLNKKVLLIDLDPQSHLTYSFGLSPSFSISEVMQGKKTIQDIIVSKEGVDICPCNRTLADVEISLINKIGREGILKNKLQDLKKYDYVFIDNPPALSLLSINALNVADFVLIPFQCEILSLHGLSKLLGTIQEVKKVLNPKLKVMGILPSMFDSRRNLSNEILQELRKITKERIFKTVIRECVKIAEAPSFAKSVLSFSPGSHGAEDFISLSKEILNDRS